METKKLKNTPFSAALRAFMKANDLKAADIAKRLEKPDSQVSKWLNLGVTPYPPTLEEIYRTFPDFRPYYEKPETADDLNAWFRMNYPQPIRMVVESNGSKSEFKGLMTVSIYPA